MARKKRNKFIGQENKMDLEMTPMIDVVFNLLIFFLCMPFRVPEGELDADNDDGADFALAELQIDNGLSIHHGGGEIKARSDDLFEFLRHTQTDVENPGLADFVVHHALDTQVLHPDVDRGIDRGEDSRHVSLQIHADGRREAQISVACKEIAAAA